MKQLLIVEDDRSLSRGLCLALNDEGFQTVPCFDLKGAREQLSCGTPALVLLDVNLPDGSGLTLLREIRDGGTPIPVILLTANDTELDVVAGLEYGADDYIVKPFSLAILRARVRVLLRREASPVAKTLDIGEYRFNFEDMTFFHGGTPVCLSKTEQRLLRLLVENRGTTMSRALLLDRIWPDGADFVDENALSVAVKRLREKLDDTRYIKTIYGLGYVWAVNPDA